ncbi:hypothetical protein [Dentiradicibacter hellwigii]|uniref:Uncharacterized protein n=1 Tax=Dentiradicibacter hellwigii TaxID=3149053 RepID=A0ABV4UH48_9RHOO
MTLPPQCEIFTEFAKLGIMIQGRISAHLERHFCGDVKTIQSPVDNQALR